MPGTTRNSWEKSEFKWGEFGKSGEDICQWGEPVSGRMENKYQLGESQDSRGISSVERVSQDRKMFIYWENFMNEKR